MSDRLKHECGLAYIRLLKPFQYYRKKYGTDFYGLHELYLLMEKQHNRGQDGAGIGVLKLDTPDNRRIHRLRFSGEEAINEIFKKIDEEWQQIGETRAVGENSTALIEKYSSFVGEVMLGHLRYGTQGLNGVQFCHPFLISNPNALKSMALAGNFNLVNTEDLFKFLHISGKEDIHQSDLGAMIEIIYHFWNMELADHPHRPDIGRALQKAISLFDGGFVFGGLLGNGDSFIVRDQHGIRPAFFFRNEEFVVAASERSAIMTCFNLSEKKIEELPAGHALIIKENGTSIIEKVAEPAPELTPCSFERIYFSRGNDVDIYKERIQLGKNVAPLVLKKLNYKLQNAIFSYIPNTAEIAFQGMVEEVQNFLGDTLADCISKNKDKLTTDQIRQILSQKVRTEKIIQKDLKMRTFITEDTRRDELVSHIYDVTYGIVHSEDTIVIIDDSIVRGTTLKNSIIKMLDRLNPKRIIIVSSAPQIRYPDCYGIDMSKLGDFIAFRAAINLVKEKDMDEVLTQIYQQCKEAGEKGLLKEINYVKKVYSNFTEEEISKKISELLHSDGIKTEIEVIYQSLQGLHQACPAHKGDWYFTGNYPTPGGVQVANKAFMNYIEGNGNRGY